jgi:hypothetical protein
VRLRNADFLEEVRGRVFVRAHASSVPPPGEERWPP